MIVITFVSSTNAYLPTLRDSIVHPSTLRLAHGGAGSGQVVHIISSPEIELRALWGSIVRRTYCFVHFAGGLSSPALSRSKGRPMAKIIFKKQKCKLRCEVKRLNWQWLVISKL